MLDQSSEIGNYIRLIMSKRHLKKKKKREKKADKRTRDRIHSKKHSSKRNEIKLPGPDESILEKMEPLNPPEVIHLDDAPKKEKVKAKGFNRSTFMKGEEIKPKKVEELPKAGFNKGAWTKQDG
jgi:hypothetical protein